jgi:hypothetical protein
MYFIECVGQQFIIGRDKRSGSQIIGIDWVGNHILLERHDNKNPSEFYDQNFHDHPDYLKLSKVLKSANPKDIGRSRSVLLQSHIGRSRHISNLSSKDPSSRRIYRQEFEFIEPAYEEKNHLS